MGLNILSDTSKNGFATSEDKLFTIGKSLNALDNVEFPMEYQFSDGVHTRQITMPKSAVVIGHKHKTEHFNMILQGRALVNMNGIVSEISAPAVFSTKAGVRKILYILEEMVWVTVHKTDKTDFEEIKKEIVEYEEDTLKLEKAEPLDFEEIKKIFLLED